MPHDQRLPGPELRAIGHEEITTQLLDPDVAAAGNESATYTAVLTT